MQVSVEKTSNVACQLKVVVPATQVEEAYKKKLNDFAKKAHIKGFRPGKVPMSYIQKQFGDAARKEAISDTIQQSLYQAIAQEKLRPINVPQVDLKELAENGPLEFVATFEVLPTIEKVQFVSGPIEKLQVDIKPEDVEYVVKQLQKQYADWREIVERPAQEKDRLVLDYHGVFEGKLDENIKVTDFTLELGSKTMWPGFEEGLVGVRGGEEKTLHLHFPDNYAVAERAGKAVDFVVSVKKIFEADLPEIGPEFLSRLGITSGNADELKAQIRKSLEQERDRLVKEKTKEQLFAQLLAQNPIDLPQSLIDREAKRIHDEVHPPRSHSHHAHTKEEEAIFAEIAKKRVAVGLLIVEYAKQAQVTLDQGLVHQRIQDIASAYERPQEVVAWLSSEARRGDIESQVLEDQVMDKMMEGANVVEKVQSFAELKNIRT